MTSLLDDYQGGILGVEIGKGSTKIPPTRKEKLQAELKILEWHKMANNAAIKSALLQTKSLKAPQPQKPQTQQSEDDSKWIKKLIQQEHIKPLEVSKDFVLDYESREKEQQERLSNQVDRHIQTLKSLRQKLEARHDMKQRNEEYRQWQKEFIPKKQAVMVGKTLDEIELKKGDDGPTEEERLDSEVNDDILRRASQRKALNGKAPNQSSQELTTVLDSLSRLAELEQRISSLEKDNRYDAMLAKENPPAFQRSSIEFNDHKMYPELSHTKVNGNVMHGVNPTEIRKKRAQPDKHGPMGVVYEVRTKNANAGGDPLLRGNNRGNQRSWKVKVPMAGSGAAAVRGKRQGQYDSDVPGEDDDEDGSLGGRRGVFITAGQTSEENLLQRQRQQQRDAAKREKARNNYLAPVGVTSLKNRRQQRKGREKEVQIGQHKHQQAMAEMQRRKQQQQQLSKGVSAAARNAQQRAVPPAKGAAAGVRTKNKHLQQFQMEKQQHQRRKEEITRGGKGAAVRGSVESRLVSQTAPVYAAKVAPRGAGTNMTRRTGDMYPFVETSQRHQPASAPEASLFKGWVAFE
eukprot:gene1599-1162_t